jgi:transcriptional regulator with PAS, ATPase and Fis domain
LRDVEISPVLTLKEAAKNAEKKTIINALEMTKGNKTKAAKFLNITYRSLLSKTKEFGI